MVEQMPEKVVIEREEDLSDGFRAPFYSVTVMIPECNVCINRLEPGKCKIYGDTPLEFRRGKNHDCPDAILDTQKTIYKKYHELYPEECKRSKLK